MKTAEYVGRILPNGNLEVPTSIREELGLKLNSEVKVILQQEESTARDQEKAAARAAVMAQLEALRSRFPQVPLNLTETIRQCRDEEDARL